MAASLCAAAATSFTGTLCAQIRNGAVLPSGAILTWGEHVDEWRDGKAKRLISNVGFGEGGCLAGEDLIVLSRPGPAPMIRVHLASGSREVIETETDFADCLWTRIYGRSGVLIIHRYSQVRLYEPPRLAGQPWTYHELYSIYTASDQGGLVQADVDADGIDDLFVGNYWMRGPERFGLPWRIFAINLYHEGPQSALGRLAVYRSRDLVWAERTGRRVTWFERPTNVREQWIAHPLLIDVDQPNGLAIDNATILVADRRQVLRWRAGRVDILAKGFRTHHLFLVDGKLWAVTPERVRRIGYRR